MIILWDEPKRLSNLQKHGLDFAELDESFLEQARMAETRKGRFALVGRMKGNWIVVVLKPLGREAVSIISMRYANKKERGHL